MKLFEELNEGTLLNKILTWSLLIETGICAKLLIRDLSAIAWFILFTVISVFILTVFYKGMLKLGCWLNVHVFTKRSNKNVFDNPKLLHKWADNACWLVMHSTGTLLELPSILNTTWLSDPRTCFIPCSIDKPEITTSVRAAYMFDLAAYLVTAYGHRFINVRKTDYYLMFVHHLTTIALILFSYLSYNHRIGMVILFLHDISDVITDFTQFLNHARIEGKDFLYAGECSFLCLITTWFYTRLVILPLRVIKSIVIDAHSMCAAAHQGKPWLYPKCEGIPFWGPAVVMLCILVCMHAYWFYLFCRILYNIVTSVKDPDQIYEKDLNSKDMKKIQ